MDKNKIKKVSIISVIVVIIIVGIGIGSYKYNKIQAYNSLINTANKDMDKGEYDQDIALFSESLQYKNDPNIQKNIKLAANLKEVKTIFSEGTKLMNDKKYLDAIDQFKKVTKEDDNLYINAKKNIEECKKQFIAENIQLANDSSQNNKYDDANKYLDNVLKLDSNNAEAKKLKDSFAKAIKDQQDKTKENTNTTVEMTSEKALKILENGYPEYTCISDGEMSTYPYYPFDGKPAYRFIFRKNIDNTSYVGYVLMDGKYCLRLASGI